MNWRVKLNGTDITAYCSGVQTRYEADAICGEVEVALASRAPLAGIVVPRVPQALAIAVDWHNGVAWESKGEYFLEEIGYPQDIDAKTATVWGRSASARLTTPWAQKISKQWAAATTVAGIIAELAALCGVSVVVTNDYPVCQYCYVASDQYPSEVIRDLATRSGQICWPQTDGSLRIAPRAYTYGTPDVELDAAEVVVQSVNRTAPDFGNRILISGDGAVAGISVTVVPMSDADACVAADGASTVRLIAVVTGSDGEPVELGTEVAWSASGGLMSEAVTQVALVQRVSEAHKATDYYHVTLDMPAESVIGVYARADLLKKTNLYALRSGSVSGTVITFGQALDYYDQSLVIDYMVQGAPNEWTAGWAPGDVTILASAAGAQGSTVLHQSNPTACPTQVTLAASSSSPCLGDAVTITLRAIMFGGAALGTAIFSLSGCGTLSAARKTLTEHEVTETLRTSVWGGVSEITLTAVPVAGSLVSVVLASVPGSNLYAAHIGQTVQLNTVLEAGTQVTATYSGGGTAKVTWTPTALPAGLEHIDEWLYTTQAEVEGVTVGQVELSRTPATSSTPICTPLSSNDDYFSSRDAKLVTLIDDPFTTDPLPAGTYIRCTYDCVWSQQADCEAVISVKVLDGSEDGGSGSITVTANDCRTVTDSDVYDPEDDTQTEEDGGTDDPDSETDPDDDSDFDTDDQDGEPSPTGCTALDINARISAVTAANIAAVAGVGNVDDCPGLCTCDQICDALRSSGKLGSAGLFYSQCVKSCTDTRAQKCTSCTLSGPDTLNPGETGTWTDNKGNSGEWQPGSVTLVSRDFATGYHATMPSGGTGPFAVKVCYGEGESQCCETTVDYPACYLTGPSELAPGAEAEYKPSLGVSGATVTGTMEEVRRTSDAIIMRHKPNTCSGWLSVSYGGQLCGMITVGSTLSSDSMAATGPATMEPGEQGYFAVATTSGNYDGLTLADAGGMIVVQQAGQGWILRMPDGATGSKTLTWTASCGRSASLSVSVQIMTDCLGDGTLMCINPTTGSGCPSSGSYCTPQGCVELTGEEIDAGSNGSVYTSPGTYTITRVQKIWSYSPMMVCNYGTNANGFGPFVWKKCQFV